MRQTKAMGIHELGAVGEDAACAFLRRLGYRIVERNYRSPFGELDVIAAKGGTLVFCEVKTRRGGDMEEALGAVDERRRKRMARAASHYLAEKGEGDVECRFDVIALLKREGGWRIMHVRDAFEVGEL